MLEGLSKMILIIIIGLGAGLYYAAPSSVTFGCMAADIFIGVWIMLTDVVDRIRKG